MANYIGVRCPVCNKKFAQTDDIVVCPICGAPHHRDCYRIKNECAFVEEHLSGNVWHAPREQSSEEDARTCAVCGTKVPKDALFCQVCGANLNTPDAPPRGVRSGAAGQGSQRDSYGRDFPGAAFVHDPLYTVYGGVEPDSEIDGIPVADYATFIGASSAYFLPRFRDMEGSGRSVSPNFPALLLNFVYYFYRRMYLIGFVLLGAYVISIIPNFLYTWETMPLLIHQMGFVELFESVGWHVPPVESVDIDLAAYYFDLSNISQFVCFLLGAAASLFANRLYFSHCTKTIHALKEGFSTLPDSEGQKEHRKEYETLLHGLGGTSKTAVAAVMITIFALHFLANGILTFIVLGG
jgi:hypothetical protein